MRPSSLLILGGARSGKSRFALARHPRDAGIAFVATAQAGDADMARRIARHRLERPPRWVTVEAPFDVAGALAALPGRIDGVIVDCVTMWVANRLLRGDADGAIVEDAEAIGRFCARRALDVTLVSNEVGADTRPGTSLGRRFQRLAGDVNQRLAAACDRVVLMVAGLPLTAKIAHPDDELPAEAP